MRMLLIGKQCLAAFLLPLFPLLLVCLLAGRRHNTACSRRVVRTPLYQADPAKLPLAAKANRSAELRSPLSGGGLSAERGAGYIPLLGSKGEKVPQYKIHYAKWNCAHLCGNDSYTMSTGLVTCKQCLNRLKRSAEQRNEAVEAGQKSPSCSPTQHKWKEEYYGYKCEVCKTFVPYGSEPWLPVDE